MPQVLFLRPSSELHSCHNCRLDPRWLLIGYGHELKWACSSRQFLPSAIQLRVFLRVEPAADMPNEAQLLPSYKPKSNEPNGIASVRASVQPPTTASSVWLTFSFAQF